MGLLAPEEGCSDFCLYEVQGKKVQFNCGCFPGKNFGASEDWHIVPQTNWFLFPCWFNAGSSYSWLPNPPDLYPWCRKLTSQVRWKSVASRYEDVALNVTWGYLVQSCLLAAWFKIFRKWGMKISSIIAWDMLRWFCCQILMIFFARRAEVLSWFVPRLYRATGGCHSSRHRHGWHGGGRFKNGLMSGEKIERSWSSGFIECFPHGPTENEYKY